MIVDLQQPGLQLLVNQNVEAKDLIHLRLVFGLFLGVRILWIQLHLHEIGHRRKGGRTSVLYVVFNLFDLFFVTNLLPQRSQRPLAALVRIQNILHIGLIDPLITRFVQTVIGQVHISFLEIIAIRLLVLDSAETSQALLVDKAMHLAVSDACDDNKNPQIKLIAVKQKWVRQIPLHDHLLRSLVRDVSNVLEEHHAIALAAVLRLCYERCILVLLLIREKLLIVLRKDECTRYKIILVGVLAVCGDAHHRLEVILPR